MYWYVLFYTVIRERMLYYASVHCNTRAHTVFTRAYTVIGERTL